MLGRPFAEVKGHVSCLSGLVPALVVGKFSGSVDCHQDRLSIRYVGDLHSAGHYFKIYNYHYELKPLCPECAIHGGQRIIVLRDRQYIGQYKPDSGSAKITHGKLVLTPIDDLILADDYRQPARISFTGDGPPSTVWVEGQTIEFFR